MLSTGTSTAKIDEVVPGNKWEFDEGVTAVFDDMLERSIPQYEVMRQACYDIACKYIKPNTPIVDVGCSRGEAIARLIDQYGAHNRFVGLEISEPMVAAASERFRGLIECNVVSIRHHDLRTKPIPAINCSVILAILTIQFTPIEYRLKILKDIYDALAPKGAFIFVEKVIGSSADIDGLMVDLYYGLKRGNGYSEDQIQRKKLSLEGVLVPVTAEWNQQMLRQTGFSQVDCFWRWMNFAGWVAIK